MCGKLIVQNNSPFEGSQNQMIPNDREPRPPSPSPPASPTVASPAGWAAAQDRPSPAPHAAGGRGARSMGAARLRPLEPPWLGPFDSAGRRQWRPFSLAPLSPRSSSQTKKKIGRRRRGGGVPGGSGVRAGAGRGGRCSSTRMRVRSGVVLVSLLRGYIGELELLLYSCSL